ncbi:hypothetical protein TIFTF001_027772 [Ficus carica]|uniref:Uncharacterized protein n=1 Tax=Ficus carica TaxID=3494 RepID=A0AA88J075_FICCA|nr:hypothetical protein TIFTF001_027772 [Ficus carica]
MVHLSIEEEKQNIICGERVLNKPPKLIPQVRSRLAKLQAASFVAATPRVATRTSSAFTAIIMSTLKVKKEYISHAKVMEKMGSAKSPIFRGKGKAGDLGKSVVEPIDLDFGSSKFSSTSRSQKRKWSKPVTCDLVLPDSVSLQNDLRAIATSGLGLLTQADLDHFLGVHPQELVDSFFDEYAEWALCYLPLCSALEKSEGEGLRDCRTAGEAID